MSKSSYEEALIDVRKLRELAEEQARDRVLKKVEPRIKQLVEQSLFGELDEDVVEEAAQKCDECGMMAEMCECGVDEASTCAAVQGYTAPLGAERKDEQLEISDESQEAIETLSELARPTSDDRFLIDVYKVHESVQKLATADKATKLSEGFVNDVDNAISKLADMYVYLRETYSNDDASTIEAKLEKSYALARGVKESTMKMKELLGEDTEMVLKVSGLPDDVDPDKLNIDLISDEEAPPADAAGASAAPGAELGAEAAPAAPAEQPKMEAADRGSEMDEVIEISESDLRAELNRLRALREADGVDPKAKAYGDADSKGHPEKAKVADLDDISEAEEGDENKEEMPETQLRRAEDDKGVKAADVHEGLEKARERLSRATKRLTEARGTDREEVARSMYRSAVRSYRAARQSLAESKTSTPVAKSAPAGDSKLVAENKQLKEQLAAANLLNAKLIHANKLLRIEGLTKAQQAMVIDRLDEAGNLREVRLISDSLMKAFVGGSNRASLKEAARRPSGSASRPSQSGASSEVLQEGLETARWAQLAGIK